MWLFTIKGFYSVVESGAGDGMVQIRARDRRHLENLRLPVEILSTPRADYPFRILLTKAESVAVISLLAQDISYTNFKDAMDRRHGPASWFSRACHEVWCVLFDLARDLRLPPSKKGIPCDVS